MLRVLLLVLAVFLTIYALVDAANAQSDRVRLMPKWLWMVAIVVFPYVGPLAWLIAGRPSNRSNGRKRGPIAPDDNPDFLRGL